MNMTASDKTMRFREKRGSALLVTLLVITTLTGLAVAFSEDSGLELSLAGYSRDAFRAYQIASSGIHFALDLLDQDQDRAMDSLNEEWHRFGSLPFPDNLPPEISVTGKIETEDSKLDLTFLKQSGPQNEERSKQLSRLFFILGIDETLAPPLLDWIDADDIPRLDGAETSYYTGLVPSYRCANDAPMTIDQIFLTKGFRELPNFWEAGGRKLSDYLTVYSDGNGKININTAPREVLLSLSERMDVTAVDGIIEYRQLVDFLTLNDLAKVPGINQELLSDIQKWLTVKSNTFTIEVEGRCQEAVVRIRAVAVRPESQTGAIRLDYWKVL